MAKNVFVKLTSAGSDTGPFAVSNDVPEVLAASVSKATLLAGVNYTMADAASTVFVTSIGNCTNSISIPISTNPVPTATPTATPTVTPGATPTPTATPTPSTSMLLGQVTYTSIVSNHIVTVSNPTVGAGTSTNIISQNGNVVYGSNKCYISPSGTYVQWTVEKTTPGNTAADTGYAQLIVNGVMRDIFYFGIGQALYGTLAYLINPGDSILIEIQEG